MTSFYLLKYIYLNRFRKLTHSDSGPFYFFGILYLVSIYQIFLLEDQYSLYIVLTFFLLQNISFLQRDDFVFLRKQIGLNKSIFLVQIDLFLISILILCVSIVKFHYLFLIELFLIIALPYTLLLRKNSNTFIKTFSSKDPLWLTHIRKKPWELLILLMVYYVQYQGLIAKNIGLFNVALFAILYFMINVFSENEKLIYLKLSNKRLKNHITEILFLNLKNISYVFIPTLLIVPFFDFSLLLNIVLVIMSGSLILMTRYFFFNQQLNKNFIGIVIIIFFASLQSTVKYTYLFLLIFILNLLLISLIKSRLRKSIDKLKL
jgi:hypothetical protein